MTKFHPAHEHDFLPAMGRHGLLPMYDPFSRLLGARRIHRGLLRRADIRAGHRVVEIGCGTGNLLRLLGRRDVDALGIDPDAGALGLARQKADKAGLPIRYEQAYARELPVPDASVDRVLSSLMLHHLGADERSRALAEVVRVLRPGGEFHVADIASRELAAELTAAGLTGATANGHSRILFGRLDYVRAWR